MPEYIRLFIPPITGDELDCLRDAIERRELAGNGHYTQLCNSWLVNQVGVGEALLTVSCTAALEMAAILSDLNSADEVIMPSYTFVSTANAVVLRGATPVFVDIRPDTLNIDEKKIESAISPRTKAIFVVHYAGVPCEMDYINSIARRHGLLVVEDAAQALLSTYHGRPAGSLGDLGCFSFHASKNITSGEGGALTINRQELYSRAYIVWEKGTNRRAFWQGKVDKYTWVDVGSSFLPNELTAAFLVAQFKHADALTRDRFITWDYYYGAFAELEARGVLRRPVVPPYVAHNAHLFYLLLNSNSIRDATISKLKAVDIVAPFHYVPLHSSPAGLRFGRTCGDLKITDDVANRLLRLPLWNGIGDRAKRVADVLVGMLQ